MKCLSNPKQFKSAVRSQTEDNVRRAVRYYTAAFALILFDKANLNKSEVERLLKAVESECAGINGGYLDFNDIMQTLKEEYDFILDLQIK